MIGRQIDWLDDWSADVSTVYRLIDINRWFKYITDAAESYKSKDSVKNRKPANQPTAETQILVGRGAGGGGGGGSSTLYETTKPVANGLV